MPMSIVTIILLAVIQGLTEFLPVSSSGHLVLAESLLEARGVGDSMQGVVLEVAVHVGTLGAVVMVYKQRIVELCRAVASFVTSGFRRTDENSGGVTYVGLIILGSVPAALVGLALRDSIVVLFDSPSVTSVLLIVTGLYLLMSRIQREERAISVPAAVIIGLAQALAILPGCSRSGWTITTGLLLGLGAYHAAEFSFLLSIPAILGALVLEIVKGSFSVSPGGLLLLVLGAVTAFVSGWLALRILLRALAIGHLYRFAYYLIPAGAAALVYFTMI